MMQLKKFHQNQIEVNPFGCRDLHSVQPTLRHLIDFITVQHQVGCESVKLSDEYDELEQAHETTYGEFKAVRDDLHRLWKVKSCVDTAARFNERTEEQKLQNRPQTRQKKEELSR